MKVRIYWPADSMVSGWDVERVFSKYGISLRGRLIPHGGGQWYGVDVSAGQARWAKYLLDQLGVIWHASDGSASAGAGGAGDGALPVAWSKREAKSDLFGWLMRVFFPESALVRRVRVRRRSRQ